MIIYVIILVFRHYLNMTHIVVKHNDLINASYRLSLTEQRIILNCIGKIRSDLPAGHQAFSIDAKEFATMHDITEKQAYFELSSAVNQLYERYLSIDSANMPAEFCQDVDINGKIEIRWLSAKATYDSSGQKVYLWFSPQIMPYLSQLKQSFTKYDISNIAKMTSAHAIRIYELLAERQFQKHKRFSMSLSDFRERLQLQNTHTSFGHLNSRVLAPAIRQINEHSNFIATLKTIKEGKKVKGLTFEFSIKPGKEPKRDKNRNPNNVVTE
jgi:plasmid replication initiation protein